MTAPHVLFAGRTTLDALYWLDGLPVEDTKEFARAFQLAPGGPACNAALTHALLGGRATLLSPIGSGPLADVVRAELSRAGVRIIDLAAGTRYETPLTTVLVNRAESTRTIVNPPAAEIEFAPAGNDWDSEWGETPAVALTDGFHLAEAFELLASLKRGGAALCLDGGSWKSGTDRLAPLLTAAICSERFVAPGLSRGVETTLDWFAQAGVPYIAVTRGAQPILGLDRGHSFQLAVRQVDAVDTLGAGDVLHGAFCFYFAATGEFQSSLRAAAEIATRSCQELGTQKWAGQQIDRPDEF